MRWLRNRYFLATDILLLPLVGYLSYMLRLERFDWAVYGVGFLLFVGLACVIVPIVFRWAGIYSRYWRYASVDEMLLLAGSVTIAVLLTSAISLAAVQLLPAKPVLPRSIPFIFLLLALAATAGPRFAVRLSARSVVRKRANGRETNHPPQTVLIMGAGDAGAMIVRELRNNPHLGLEPVGFLDDDLGKHDVKIHGVPVLGDRHAIPEMAAAYKVNQVIIAMPTAPGAEIRDIMRICGEAGVQARTIPGIYELLGGTVSVSQLREVRIEDLLRREPVRTDVSAVSGMLRGKRVLVTGAGGSIGTELCRQILHCEPAELVLVGHGENSIFEIHNELRRLETRNSKLETETGIQHPTTSSQQPASGIQLPESSFQNPASRITPIIADIRFPDRIRAVFEAYRPEIVFHAGAHKHVPLMESNEVEAITNNVLGTRNVVEAAVATGVERFLMISTDKAVNPTSVMGASKRVAEMVVTHAGREQRSGGAEEQGSSSAPLPLCTVVRFGNVLGSRGSVVPFFQKQIAAGGPVTVTDPEMRRYFMTIPEAVQLVLQAAALGHGGELFVLDMGEPVRITDLARDLIRLSGLEPDREIEIRFTGLRPGEKLFEELFLENEDYSRTRHEKIFVCRNGTEHGEGESSQVAVDALIAAAQRGEAGEVRRRLHELVPEYQGKDTATR